ncbi:LysR family transcriptional regulator [Cryobacterium sp. TMT2-17-1]|uniref:LysR family transcriptional regulator n=1 Tax=Cryobacterium sandaracinum TaxID=1259247 RepID=A0ABY2J9P4_9MICO|nr:MULTISPECIES: LysR family transcriptional regulator [Cryobacterium]TFB54524.1 LysR family transcriptional regulator [Cryobacterium sp. Sr3]TFB64432.1 LysR family transcriptional regulator [Cryobacterium sp. Hz7]TFC49656.1 LysR family transcriptional regulator [Cryobacterium sp. TMT2-17-1]TFD00617.1 LysR family transcriptional regulator [Cryobacterium sandaracinum]
MDITLLRHFIAVAEELHFPRAAMNLNISTPKLRSSIAKLEANIGVVLIDRTTETTRLTAAGNLFLTDARTELAASDESWKPPLPAGGKAKAAKGKGRAPEVKGQPRPGKRRQGR